MVFTTTLLAVLLAVLTLAFFVRLPQPFDFFVRNDSPGGLFSLQLTTLFSWQLMHIRSEEYNVDESTWIADTLAVAQSKDFFATLLTHTTSRPVTVLPLLLLDKLQLPVDFYHVKVVALVCIILTLLLTYLLLRNLTSARLALLGLFPLTIFYLAVQFDDFLAYNSEFVCNVFVAGGIWLFSLITRKQDRPWQIGLVGCLLGLIPFAKFQAIPGALVVAGFCLYLWIRQRRFSSLALFTATGLGPLLGAIGYCLYTDQMTVLVRNYLLYYVYYSYQYSSLPFSERFSPRHILYYYRKQYTFAAYWFGLISLAAFSWWQIRRRPVEWSPTVLLACSLWAVSIYETVQAGTGYEHYLQLALVPHTVLAAVVIYPFVSQPAPRTTVVYCGYVLVAIGITFFSRAKAFHRGYEPPLPNDAAIVAFINQQCGPTDRIAVWGWADRYYVLSGVAPATRYANSVFQMKANAQQAYYLDQYVRDLRRERPVLFLDAVADKQFTYHDRSVYGHEHFPQLSQFIGRQYRLIGEQAGVRMYRLTDH